MQSQRNALIRRIAILAAVVGVLAWGFSSCAAAKEAKRIEQKGEQRAVQISLGALFGAGLAIITGVALWPMTLAGGGAVLIVAAVEPEQVFVTVEDGGTAVFGVGDVARLKADLEETKREIDRNNSRWSLVVRKWVERFAAAIIIAVVGYLLARWEWLRRFLIKKAGETHSRFWSLVHAFIGGEWSRKLALQIKEIEK